jgi:hypothetical protein
VLVRQTVGARAVVATWQYRCNNCQFVYASLPPTARGMM